VHNSLIASQSAQLASQLQVSLSLIRCCPRFSCDNDTNFFAVNAAVSCAAVTTTVMAAGNVAPIEMAFSLDLDGLDTLWCICLETENDAVAEHAIKHLCTLCLYNCVEYQLEVCVVAAALHIIKLLQVSTVLSASMDYCLVPQTPISIACVVSLKVDC
jgi:hypothetical protein